jgi:hypothetical protein
MWTKLLFAWHSRGVARRVRRLGWNAVRVGDYGKPPCWNYSVGFWESAQAPEIIVFDLPSDAVTGLFAEVHRQLLAGDLVIEDGAPWPMPGAPTPTWRRVHPTRLGEEWFTLAQWYKWKRSGDPELSAFQLVLADDAGRYPWDSDYVEALRRFQPELYLPAPTAH